MFFVSNANSYIFRNNFVNPECTSYAQNLVVMIPNVELEIRLVHTPELLVLHSLGIHDNEQLNI